MSAPQYCRLNKKGLKQAQGRDAGAALSEQYRSIGLPAHKAVVEDDIEALQKVFLELEEKGVPLEDQYGSSPLHLAARFNRQKIAKWLLQNTDIDPTLRAKKGETVYHVAAVQGSLPTMEALVSHSSKYKEFIATSLDDSCFTPLHLAIIRHHNQVARYLISELGNKSIGPVNMSSVNAAHVAASVGNVEVLKMIANKNKKMLQRVANDLTTPAFFAAQEGHFLTLKYLHEKGKADLGCRSSDGMSPIHAASQNGHLEIVQYLASSLGKSATFDQTPDGSTPLHFAASAGHEAIVRWLINNDLTGTIAFIQDANGDTPAHDAADNGHTEVLKLLLENGADIHAANKDGLTPYSLASQGPHSEIATFVTQYAATSPVRAIPEKSSKMNIFDFKEKENKEAKSDDPQTENATTPFQDVDLSAYDVMDSSFTDQKIEKEKKESTSEPKSEENLLEWNKEELSAFDHKPKFSGPKVSTSSDDTFDGDRRASKRQSRKVYKSIKQHISENSGMQEAPFAPNENINPLMQEGEDSVYAKPDPEVVKRKTLKRITEQTEESSQTSMVNENYEDEANTATNKVEDEDDETAPIPPPQQFEVQVEDNTHNSPSDNDGPVTTATAPQESTTDKEEVEEQKPAEPEENSSTDKDQPSSDQHKPLSDQTTPQLSELPSMPSPGKYGLRGAKTKEYNGFTSPENDFQSGAGDELRKIFSRRKKN